MRPFTICYGLMTIALGSVAAYGFANADDLRSPFGDTRAFAYNATADSQPTILLPPAKPADSCGEEIDSCCDNTNEAVAVDTPAAADSSPTIIAGMSASEVEAVLGSPDAISSDGARWTYGSNVLIFSNDRLTGQVAFDPIQAAMNKYNNMLASIENSAPESKSASTGPKILRAKTTAQRASAKYLYKPISAGSARQAYRYDRNRNEYSYYMNRMGPMDRMFSGKRFLPRGMMTTTERNLGQSYLNYGAARYATPSNTQYRR